MRMSLKRMTRQTNALYKKLQNHVYALALYFVWYNFYRVHESLDTTPAVKAGLADYPRNMRWIIEELVNSKHAPRRRDPYRKRAA